MKFVSWNVNGLRACLEKGFLDVLREQDADFFCIQETKMQEGQASFDPQGYDVYYNSAQRKGYSGTAVFSRHKPLSVRLGIGKEDHDTEGRVITLEFPAFFLVNVYTPNSQAELARLSYRMEWEDAFCAYLCALDQQKPVIVCGDFNVAHKEIDLKNPQSNRKNAGFTDEEREKFTSLLDAGFVDTFRLLYPDRTEAYSWWSYRFGARKRNAGWRIDYFLVSKRLSDKVEEATICSDILGSDHCPVTLSIALD